MWKDLTKVAYPMIHSRVLQTASAVLALAILLFGGCGAVSMHPAVLGVTPQHPPRQANPLLAEPAVASVIYLPMIQFELPPPPIPEPNPSPALDQCEILSIDPKYSSSFMIGTSFKMKWVLKNTSDTTWDASQVDVRFLASIGNINFHLGQNVYDLRNSVNSGDTYEVALDARAPSIVDVYGERWAIAQGGQSLCEFTQLIWVR